MYAAKRSKRAIKELQNVVNNSTNSFQIKRSRYATIQRCMNVRKYVTTVLKTDAILVTTQNSERLLGGCVRNLFHKY